jgi:hypothetical protein
MTRQQTYLTERAKIAEQRVSQVEERERETLVKMEMIRMREEKLHNSQSQANPFNPNSSEIHASNYGATPAKMSLLGGSLFSPEERGGLGLNAELGEVMSALEAELERQRDMYGDLEIEHEDLLALLAQQEIEKGCLRDALRGEEGGGGEDRVRAAQQEAETICITKYKQYIALGQ